MTPGQLIQAIATATGKPEATVRVYARTLREEGMLTTGARGVNAPDMQPEDAAKLLLALLVIDKPSKSREAVRDFGGLICNRFDPSGDNAEFTFSDSCHLPDDHSFVDALSCLIEIYGYRYSEPFFVAAQFERTDRITLLPSCRIELRVTSLEASVYLPGGRYDYGDALVDPRRNPVPELSEFLSKAGKQTISESDHLAHEQAAQEYTALMEAHHEKWDRYRSPIKKVHYIESDVIDSIGHQFDEVQV